MRGLPLALAVLMLFSSASCATTNNYDAIGQSLTDINQKVTGHYYGVAIPDDFDAVQYKKAVEDVCKDNPPCQEKTAIMFNNYDVKAQKVDKMHIFTVLICEKHTGKKLMEAYSCNNMKVTVLTYKIDLDAPCEFEKDWEKIIKDNCP